jgi:hypothetical protein
LRPVSFRTADLLLKNAFAAVLGQLLKLRF